MLLLYSPKIGTLPPKTFFSMNLIKFFDAFVCQGSFAYKHLGARLCQVRERVNYL